MKISEASQNNTQQINSTSNQDVAKKTTGSLNGLTVAQAHNPAEQPSLLSRNASTAKSTFSSVDRLSSVGAPSISRLAPATLPEGQRDKAYDGATIGAGGKAYPAGTPLTDIPPVRPSNGQPGNETIIYVNGIRNEKSDQANSMQAIADRTGANVIGIHNATEKTFKDLLQSLGDKVDIGKNPAVDSVANAVYDQLKKGQDVHLMGHSQGALILSRALTDVRRRLMAEDGMSSSQAEKLMGKIKVETFGGAAGSYPNGPQYVHYVNRADPVPGLLGLGSFKAPFSSEPNAGRGAVVHRFTDFSGVHDLNDTYLSQRVPFDQARQNRF